MAAIQDISDLINKSTSGNNGNPQNIFWHKVNRVAGVAATNPIAGRLASLWRYDGQPGGGSIPTVGEITTSATSGAMPIVSATGGRDLYMTQAWGTGTVAGTLLLYDRLYHIGGLNGTTTTAQTVQGSPASPQLTRNVSGLGNFAFVEIYTAIGTTSRNITMSYTNELGVSGRTSVATAIGAAGFLEISRVILLTLQSGDKGIQSVQSVTINTSTGTAGNFGVTIGKIIGYIGVGAPGAPGWRDYIVGLPGIPLIEPGACLSLLWSPNTTTAPEVLGGFSLVES